MSMEDKECLKKFYEEVGEKYPEEEKVYHTLRGRLRKKFVLTYLKNFEGKLLDVGCNRGMYLRHYLGGPRFGIDLSHSVLKKVPKTAALFLAVGDAERLFFFKKNTFDALLCSEVLEHCLDPLAVFQGIAYVLRPGGKALITTPNYRKKRTDWIDMGELVHYDVHSECDDTYFHTAYRPQELADLAASVNLKIKKLGTLEKEIKYATKIPVLFLLAGRLVNRIFRSSRFDQFNQKLFDQMSIGIYSVCRITGLDKLFSKMVKEGVRSYIILTKSG